MIKFHTARLSTRWSTFSSSFGFNLRAIYITVMINLATFQIMPQGPCVLFYPLFCRLWLAWWLLPDFWCPGVFCTPLLYLCPHLRCSSCHIHRSVPKSVPVLVYVLFTPSCTAWNLSTTLLIIYITTLMQTLISLGTFAVCTRYSIAILPNYRYHSSAFSMSKALFSVMWLSVWYFSIGVLTDSCLLLYLWSCWSPFCNFTPTCRLQGFSIELSMFFFLARSFRGIIPFPVLAVTFV